MPSPLNRLPLLPALLVSLALGQEFEGVSRAGKVNIVPPDGPVPAVIDPVPAALLPLS